MVAAADEIGLGFCISLGFGLGPLGVGFLPFGSLVGSLPIEGLGLRLGKRLFLASLGNTMPFFFAVQKKICCKARYAILSMRKIGK